MAKKIALKLGYESPFTVYSVFSTQKDYRLAWLLNQALGLELKRIEDFTHYFSESSSSQFPVYNYYLHEYRMHVFLTGNKSAGGSIIGEAPVADYLLIFWNLSDIFNLKQFQKDLRKIPQIQTIVGLKENVLKKYEAFFYDLEFFLTEQKII